MSKTVKLIINDNLAELLEKRHISEDEVQNVIEQAERTGQKLHRPDVEHFLAKLIILEPSIYVEYSILDEGYLVHSVYSHNSTILTEIEEVEDE